MSTDFEDSLLSDDDEISSELIKEDSSTVKKSLDARREIERRRELMRLRKLLDDPSYDYEID